MAWSDSENIAEKSFTNTSQQFLESTFRHTSRCLHQDWIKNTSALFCFLMAAYFLPGMRVFCQAECVKFYLYITFCTTRQVQYVLRYTS